MHSTLDHTLARVHSVVDRTFDGPDRVVEQIFGGPHGPCAGTDGSPDLEDGGAGSEERQAGGQSGRIDVGGDEGQLDRGRLAEREPETGGSADTNAPTDLAARNVQVAADRCVPNRRVHAEAGRGPDFAPGVHRRSFGRRIPTCAAVGCLNLAVRLRARAYRVGRAPRLVVFAIDTGASPDVSDLRVGGAAGPEVTVLNVTLGVGAYKCRLSGGFRGHCPWVPAGLCIVGS